MMKLMMSGSLAAILLAACGGGTESSTSGNPAPPVRTEPGAPNEEIPQVKPGTSVQAPPLDAHAMTLASPSIHFTSDALSMLIQQAGVSNLDLNGNGNKVWISEGQAMHHIAVSGTSNTIVMMRGATVDALTVSVGNTVYLPLGSPIVVDGGATVKYYAA